MSPQLTTEAVTWDVQRLVEDVCEQGLSTVALARKAGLSYMTVNRFLKGRTRTPRTVSKLAKALGYTSKRYLIRTRR